jgi:DNA repair protein RecO (recombination protein O)
VGRTYKTEAVVLRSIRLGEADRVLHVYTLDRGRVGAVAKGIRKTKSRYGARLEPLSHVELMLHQGSGELHTVTGVELLHSHHEARENSYRLGVALAGAEAVLRLFTEQEANPKAFGALVRFLEVVDDLPARTGARPAVDPLALAFQLKLLWLSGYQPHLDACADCGADDGLVGYSARAGGMVCGACANGTLSVTPASLATMRALLRATLAEAAGFALGERETRETAAVINASHEYHGGFRLRTLSA